MAEWTRTKTQLGWEQAANTATCEVIFWSRNIQRLAGNRVQATESANAQTWSLLEPAMILKSEVRTQFGRLWRIFRTV